jgi:outer membrane lipoprotein
MRHIVYLILLSLAAPAFIGGCATQTFDTGLADRTVTPRDAADRIAALGDRQVAWGGVIVAAKNLSNSTEFEVLGYPLDENNRPDPMAEPVGRFIAVHPGYLETADYKAGRLVTVVGNANETRAGTVGEAKYVYPVVATKRLQLWPVADAMPSRPSIHFGIGIGIIR